MQSLYTNQGIATLAISTILTRSGGRSVWFSELIMLHPLIKTSIAELKEFSSETK